MDEDKKYYVFTIRPTIPKIIDKPDNFTIANVITAINGLKLYGNPYDLDIQDQKFELSKILSSKENTNE